MMTIREMFEKSKKHLLTQNAKATNDFGKCMYRGANNTSCAVGYLIDDEFYDPIIEGLEVSRATNPEEAVEHVFRDALEKSGVPLTPKAMQILSMLQAVHDIYAPQEWAVELDRVEARVKLYENAKE